jgi:hypothetical protein
MDKFVGYCLYNIEKAIRRQLWDSEFKACCEFIAGINSTIEFTKEQNIRFAEKLKPRIKALLPIFSTPAQIVAYGNYLHKQGDAFLLELIVAYLKDNKDNKDNE